MEAELDAVKLCDICGREVYVRNFQLHQLKCQQQTASKIRPVMNSSILYIPNEGAEAAVKPIKVNPEESKIAASSKLSVVREDAIVCPQCGSGLSLEELDTHSKDCEAKLMRCEYCDGEFMQALLPDHQEICQAKKYLDSLSQERPERPRRREQERPRRAPPLRRSSSGEIQGYEQGPSRSYEFGELNQSLSNALRNLQSRGLQLSNLLELLRIRSNSNSGLSGEEVSNLVHEKYKKRREDDLCTICYCNLEEGESVIRLPCLHLYHDDCLAKWFKQSAKCPVCKHDVHAEDD